MSFKAGWLVIRNTASPAIGYEAKERPWSYWGTELLRLGVRPE
jgi:hypothetical protein